MYEAGQIFVYEIKKNSAVIWRCFSRDTKAELPKQLEGYPVTEVAPYAFSAHMGEKEIEEGLAAGRLRMYVPKLFRGESGRDDGFLPAFPPLCGEALEEVVLPPSLLRVGRYCFYNCGHLHRLTFYGGLSDWGSGVFTGCHQVNQLRVYTDAQGKSYLKDVLDELPEALRVEYYAENDRCTELVFPEFYEEGVENTPARILETHVHGSGIRYRNCFNGRKFDFHQYDVLFPHAEALEAPEIVGRLVMNRLRHPLELTDRAREQYENYVRKHAEELADLILEEKDIEGARWLLDLLAGQSGRAGMDSEKKTSQTGTDSEGQSGRSGQTGTDSEGQSGQSGTDAEGQSDQEAAGSAEKDGAGMAALLNYMTERASRLQQTESMSFLMDYRRAHSSGSRKRKRLEL